MEYLFYFDTANGPIDNGTYHKCSFPYGVDSGLIGKVDRVRCRESGVGGEVVKDQAHVVRTS